MITALVRENNEISFIRTTTRCYRHLSRTSHTAKKTQSVLASLGIADRLQALPSNRNFEGWATYLSTLIPFLDEALQAYQVRSIQRARFAAYMARDKALDS
jgi:hypothetical protein